MRDVILFWVDQGVRIFRVDNPHTKPLPFWEWLIREVQARDPDVIFLAEAFTRPKVMKALAKLGFTQSYTYFTWRTDKAEIAGVSQRTDRLSGARLFPAELLRQHAGHPAGALQTGEPWMFKSRVALAATLSSNYGIYNGFELLEHEPIPGREEYLNSEKYEIKMRDWNKPGNIKDYIERLNTMRRDNPALLQTADLRFLQIDDDDVIGFVKESVDRRQCRRRRDRARPNDPQDFWLHFGDIQIGPPAPSAPVRLIENLSTGERHWLEWGGVRLRIDPAARSRPAVSAVKLEATRS